MGNSCSDVCEAVSEIICAVCPRKKECLDNDLMPESDFHDKLIECVHGKLKLKRSLKEVLEQNAGDCPYCNYKMAPNEGTSVMHKDGHCVICCASCGKSYFYQT